MSTPDTTADIKSAHTRLDRMAAPKTWLKYAITIELPAFAHMAPEQARYAQEVLIQDFAQVIGLARAYIKRDGLQVRGTSRTIKVSDHYEQEWEVRVRNRFTVIAFDCQVDPHGATVPDSVPSVGE